MKKILIWALALTLTSCAAFASTAPYGPEEEARFEAIENMANGTILMGNASGVGVEVTPSGDATITNAGVVAIASGVVTEADLLVQSADGLHAKRVARATLDCGVSSCVAGDVAMGVTIPANAIMLRAWYYTVTQFVDGGAGTVALKCEDAGNIDAAADITGIAVGAITQTDLVAGAEVAAIASACVITATIATAEQTAGKLILFVEYVIAE